MPEFAYQDPFPLGPDTTEYRKLTSDFVSIGDSKAETILQGRP